METKFSVVIASIGGAVGYMLGGYDTLLIVFLTVLGIDTVTGMIKAWSRGEYESKKFRQGIVKKIAYMLATLLAVQIDILLGNKGMIRGACLTLFIANESISVVENLSIMGIKVPQFFLDALKVLQDKSDKGE